MSLEGAARKAAATLIAVVTACALIAAGSTPRGTSSTPQHTVAHTHAAAHLATAHIAPATGKHHAPAHPDLTATTPSIGGATPHATPDLTASARQTRVAHHFALPNGRGPPAS